MHRWRIWAMNDDGAEELLAAGEGSQYPGITFLRAHGRPTRFELSVGNGAPWRTRTDGQVVDLDDRPTLGRYGDPAAWPGDPVPLPR